MGSYKLIRPGEDLDYAFDYRAEADDAGSPSDTISSSSWSVTPQADASPTAPKLSDGAFSGVLASVRITDCTAGNIYRLTNTVVWSSGIITKKTVVLRCA